MQIYFQTIFTDNPIRHPSNNNKINIKFFSRCMRIQVKLLQTHHLEIKCTFFEARALEGLLIILNRLPDQMGPSVIEQSHKVTSISVESFLQIITSRRSIEKERQYNNVFYEIPSFLPLSSNIKISIVDQRQVSNPEHTHNSLRL